MSLSTDGTASLRGLEIGEGTDYCIAGVIGGLSSLPDVRTSFGPRGGRDGDAGGVETFGPRLLTFPVATQAAPDDCEGGVTRGEAAGLLHQELKRAWTRLGDDSSTDLELQLRQAWFETADKTLRFYGRPRMPKAGYEGLRVGYFDALLEFICVDPFGYGDAVPVTGSSSPVNFTNDGDAPTTRFTVTIAGNGGTPILTSVTDGGSVLAFQSTFSGTAILDFRAHGLTVSGVDSYQLLTPAPEWFVLPPGPNQLTFTGAASILVDYQPAYL